MTELNTGEQIRILVNTPQYALLREGDIVTVTRAELDEDRDFTVDDPRGDDYWFLNIDSEGILWERVGAASPVRMGQRTRTVTEPVIVLELTEEQAHELLGVLHGGTALDTVYEALAEALEND